MTVEFDHIEVPELVVAFFTGQSAEDDTATTDGQKCRVGDYLLAWKDGDSVVINHAPLADLHKTRYSNELGALTRHIRTVMYQNDFSLDNRPDDESVERWAPVS